jgi:hypothetical protein
VSFSYDLGKYLRSRVALLNKQGAFGFGPCK